LIFYHSLINQLINIYRSEKEKLNYFLFLKKSSMKTPSRFNRVIPTLAVIAAVSAPLVAFAAGAQDLITPVANSVLATVRVLVTVVFVLAIVAFGWGIVQFIFAGGDPTALGKAKSFLLWGVIGMAVMASLFGLTQFLQNYFGVNSGDLIVKPPNVL
jgi:hypothetical protein